MKKYGELKVDKYLKTHMWSLDILWFGFKKDANATEKYFIKEFDSINNGLNLTSGGEHYISSEEANKIQSIKKRGVLKPNHKEVYQYDLSGNFIAKWSSVSMASENNGVNKYAISNNARGCTKTAGGFIWSYTFKDDIQPPQYKKPKSRSKRVAQYTNDGTLVIIYDSINHASRVLSYNSGNISRATRGIHKTYKGFIWKIIDE